MPKIRNGGEKLYSSLDIKKRIATDLWMLKEVLFFPHDPIWEIKPNVLGGISSIAMPLLQENARHYQNALAPLIFVASQKIYAELFRLVLSQSNIPVGSEVQDIKKKIMNGPPSRLIIYPTFIDSVEFDEWWTGKRWLWPVPSSYSLLQNARNKIIHDEFTISNNSLIVNGKNGAILLNWTSEQVLIFASNIKEKACDAFTKLNITCQGCQ